MNGILIQIPYPLLIEVIRVTISSYKAAFSALISSKVLQSPRSILADHSKSGIDSKSLLKIRWRGESVCIASLFESNRFCFGTRLSDFLIFGQDKCHELAISCHEAGIVVHAFNCNEFVFSE